MRIPMPFVLDTKAMGLIVVAPLLSRGLTWAICTGRTWGLGVTLTGAGESSSSERLTHSIFLFGTGFEIT